MQVAKLIFLAAVVGLLAAGCGYPAVCACGAELASPTPTNGARFDVTATNADHAVTMRVGQKLEVVLRAGQGMNNWTHPTPSDPSVLQSIVDPAATAMIGVTLAALQAVKAGQVDVTSNSSPNCSPGQACPMYLAVYSLKVTVTS
jgi:hypothetical protein